jgi:hypothetical protein
VVLIAHNELGHDDAASKTKTGEQADGCPLYPGMTCREHCDAAVDIDTARGEGLTQVPFIELCPNSWLVPPSGEPERIAEEDQFVAGKVEAQVEKMQKRLGDSLSRARFPQIRSALEQSAARMDEEDWRGALEALRGIAALAKDPPPSLRNLIGARLAVIDEEVRFAFEDAIEVGQRDDTPMSERIETVGTLVKAVDRPVFGDKLPVLPAMQAWLKQR